MLEEVKGTRVQLKGAPQVTRRFFPMAVAAVDVGGVCKQCGVVVQRPPRAGKLSAGAPVVAETFVVVIGQGEMGFARLRLQLERSLRRRIGEIEPGRGVIVALPIDIAVHPAE